MFQSEIGFSPGLMINDRYEVLDKIGEGWESEVFSAKELRSGLDCAIKVFLPKRNPANRISRSYAQRLIRLAQCPYVISYYSTEFFLFEGQTYSAIVAEMAEGEILSHFLKKQPSKRLNLADALQLLHSLVVGLEFLHHLGEYHGDLHSGNIVIRRRGVGFDFKLLDMHTRKESTTFNKQTDLCDLIRIFYDSLGGAKQYSKLRLEAKEICLGLKTSLILKKFKNASVLRHYLENFEWDEA